MAAHEASRAVGIVRAHGSMYSNGGFVLAIVAIPIALIAWPAVLLAGVRKVRRVRVRDGRIREEVCHGVIASGHDSRIHAATCTSLQLAPDEGYRLVTPTEASQAQLYPTPTVRPLALHPGGERPDRDQRASLYVALVHRCARQASCTLEVRDGRPLADTAARVDDADAEPATRLNGHQLRRAQAPAERRRSRRGRHPPDGWTEAHPFRRSTPGSWTGKADRGRCRTASPGDPRRQCQPARAAAPDAVLEFLAPFRALDVARSRPPNPAG